MTKSSKFRFAIDRGGTFTDIYAELPGGEGFRVLKLLSEDPENYDDAPREGIRRIVESFSGKKFNDADIGAEQIEWIRMGTTVATNALLERKGTPSALIITKGFRDLLHIGYQNRPRLFDLRIKKPDLLYEQVIEIEERIRIVPQSGSSAAEKSAGNIISSASGDRIEILETPDEERIKTQLSQLLDKGIKCIAVVFMHAYAYPNHEITIGKIARELGFEQVSLSHEVMPMIKIVARGDTTMVDAYLTPHIREYIDHFRSGFHLGLQGVNLQFMQSDGGLKPADRIKGSNAILSGPAGGVVGYAMTTWQAHESQPVIGFDMGGTSTDVSRFDGIFDLVHETETAGVRIQAPQLNINTVAAGGGSRLFYQNGLFVVGPESAGAHPGPVCYRKRGHLALTDANLLLGRIQADYFPKIFGKSSDQSLDREAVTRKFDELRTEIDQSAGASTNHSYDNIEEIALGFVRVANETMIRSIREISIMRGFDIKDHVLACFGGAGGQHACAIARSLGLSRIVIHRFGGILSAYGMGLADVVAEKQEPSAWSYAQENFGKFQDRLEILSESARQELKDQGFADNQIRISKYLNLRYQGTDTSFMISEPDDLAYDALFKSQHQREFGFDLIDRTILVDDIRVRATAAPTHIQRHAIPVKKGAPVSDSVQEVYFEDGWHSTPVFLMEELGAGQQIPAPAIIIQDISTIVLEPGCDASITDFGDIIIDVRSEDRPKFDTRMDPIRLSIFSNLFMSIAEQMGRSLQRTSVSTNIKERQDYSCAVFDAQGRLIANAPHQPVHLGAMGEAVRKQIEIQGSNLQEGDVLLTNHPIAGGSHLPDLTVITPVWNEGKPVFFVASRGHHADIGGISPGSMPPFSKFLDEEGVCIKSLKLVESGKFQEALIRDLFTEPKILGDKTRVPGSRLVADNISDLKAQVAANQKGIELLTEMVEKYSLEVVQAYMGHIQTNAENAVRSMLKEFSTNMNLKPIDTIEAEELLDDGSPIRLTLTIDREKGSAVFDFSGTGKQLEGNLNAPQAVTYSAILYCLRCLIEKEMPLNHGCLGPIDVIMEKGSLLWPSETAAVVGGNVLTSQRITDVIFKAFSAVAGSQGCMNNLTFGNKKIAYYETIGGGAGAGNGWHGQSGVHTHMTNTRITDPEILEQRYPVLLRKFSLRDDSGGQGKYRGGDGIIREIEFLDDMNVAILSERRIFAPYGLQGGQPGKKGQNLFLKADGQEIDLGGKNEILANPGDRIRIQTPGGGGYGT